MKPSKLLTIVGIIGASLLSIKEINAQDSPLIKGNISSKISSAFIPPMVGAVLGTGPHQQNSLNLDIGKFSFYTWSSTDLGGNLGKGEESNEFDVGTSYSTNIKRTKNHALSAKAGFERWNYTGDYDNIILAGLDYQGPVNASLTAFQAIGHDEIPTANSFLTKISKSFQLGKAFSITPRISAAYMNDFYGDKGLAHTTIGTEFNYQTNLANIIASIDRQVGFIKENPIIHNQTYASVGINVDF